MISKEQKEKFFETLREQPIISIACKRAGIARATVYRLLSKDKKFKEAFEKTKVEGREGINDLAESKLIKKVSDGEKWAIMYWLEYNHPTYMNKLSENRYNKNQSMLVKTRVTEIVEAMEAARVWRDKHGSELPPKPPYDDLPSSIIDLMPDD